MNDKIIIDKALKEAFMISGINYKLKNINQLDIYNHKFAKTLWGAGWKHHLTRMVLSEDPIKYLGENI